MKKIFLYCMLFANFVFLTGCVSLNKDYPDVKSYSIRILREKNNVVPSKRITLKINAFDIAEQFATKNLVYKKEKLNFNADYYNRFTSYPEIMLADQMREWFSKAPFIKEVILPEDSRTANYSINAYISEIYGDFSKQEKLKAVISIKLTVLDVQNDAVVLSKLYREEINLKKMTVSELIEGYQSAFRKVLGVFESDINKFTHI